MAGILIIAHAPLASALRDCAAHVYCGQPERLGAIDVLPDAEPAAVLAQARDKLAQDWGRYSAGQRAHCVRLSTLGGLPSYVELLTCLELAKAAAELPDDSMETGGRIER